MYTTKSKIIRVMLFTLSLPLLVVIWPCYFVWWIQDKCDYEIQEAILIGAAISTQSLWIIVILVVIAWGMG